jgi:hypothetical protein
MQVPGPVLMIGKAHIRVPKSILFEIIMLVIDIEEERGER